EADECAQVVAVRARPQIEKAVALELAAEQRADPGAGDAERMPPPRVEGENERIGKHAADGAGLDVATFRGEPPPPLLVPIIVQLAYRRMLHRRPCPARVRCSAVTVPVRERGVVFSKPRSEFSRGHAGMAARRGLGIAEDALALSDAAQPTGGAAKMSLFPDWDGRVPCLGASGGLSHPPG